MLMLTRPRMREQSTVTRLGNTMKEWPKPLTRKAQSGFKLLLGNFFRDTEKNLVHSLEVIYSCLLIMKIHYYEHDNSTAKVWF